MAASVCPKSAIPAADNLTVIVSLGANLSAARDTFCASAIDIVTKSPSAAI